ncbi:MAG: peptidoglycan editing factor PgeF [Alphaproteobacteria bacterium]|nr:peptidoglycan editing factor PgeF [Alphaproteobacteria bacterium]
MTLEIITSDDLTPRQHGFFTRHGGVSSGIFKGLNCGAGSSDQTDAVLSNRGRVAAVFDLPLTHLTSLHQTHSSRVLTVVDPVPTSRPKCDAMVTNVAGIALGILTADCQPVLFSDPEAGVIGAAHAGWKGALGGVLEATLDAMEALGANRRRISAVIGPCISQRAYEVGPEFMDHFVAEHSDYASFFANGKGDRLLFDLPSFGLFRLREAGVNSASWTGHCTYCDAEKFYSYRRSCHMGEADYGRLISVISLRNPRRLTARCAR